MIDHICCDIEEKIATGHSFDEALRLTMHDIPEHHFKTIQRQTMETINKRITYSRWLSFAALALLLCSVIFRILHLQFSDELLLTSFAMIVASLLTSSVSGIYTNRDKKGTIGVLTVIAGVVVMLIGYTFKFLHWPGADQIVVIASVLLIVSLVINTLFVYSNASGHGNLLTFLHEKHTPGIERFLLLLLLPITLYKVVVLLSGAEHFVGGVVLLIVMFAAGFQLIAWTWRNIENNPIYRNPLILTALIITSLCLVLVFLGQLIPFEIRVVMIMLYTSVAAWLAINWMNPKPLRL